MKQKSKEKVIPILPEGIRVAERPVGLEFMQRGNERWMLVIQALNALSSTECIQIDISGLNKGQIQGMKSAIKHAGLKLGHKPKIRFAMKGEVLLVWSNL